MLLLLIFGTLKPLMVIWGRDRAPALVSIPMGTVCAKNRLQSCGELGPSCWAVRAPCPQPCSTARDPPHLALSGGQREGAMETRGTSPLNPSGHPPLGSPRCCPGESSGGEG